MSEPLIIKGALSQTGTEDPVAVIDHNDTGIEPTFRRDGAGNYRLIIEGVFTERTRARIENSWRTGAQYLNTMTRASEHVVVIHSQRLWLDNGEQTEADGGLNGTPFEIEVYPAGSAG